MTEPIPPLVEYKDEVLSLDPEDASFLRSAWPRATRLTCLGGDLHLFNPGPCVGVVTLPSGRRLQVGTKVPLRNLLYMLWRVSEDTWPFLEEAAEFEENENILEFLASHFTDLVHRRVDSGLYRSYQDREENLPMVRGRINFPEDLRSNHALRHRAFCRYAEFTWDVPDNQIIRQVAHLLAGWGFRKNLELRLRQIDAALSEVSTTSLCVSDLERLHYDRFNEDYRQIHRLCRLFLQGASISEEPGPLEFRAFLLDMNALFQEFVARVLQDAEQGTFQVRAPKKGELWLDESKEVPLQPDLVILRDGQVQIVADCKYKLSVDRHHNPDLYQLLAYCTAINVKVGVLIYPLETTPVFESVYVPNARTHIYQVTLDLSRTSIAELEEECDKLAKTILALPARWAAAA